MAGNAKEIQRRIKSIKSTKKITKAMEMVAAAKMKKEVAKVLAIRDYAHSAWGMLTNLSKAFENQEHGLLEVREVKKILVVLISSNSGLCGVYNAQVIKKLTDHLKKPSLLKVNRIGNRRIFSKVKDEDLEFDFVCSGKKGFDFLNKSNKNVLADFNGLDSSPKLEDSKPLSQMLINEYKKRNYDKVLIAYTDFKNAMIQEPKLRQLLPISKIDLEKQIEEMSGDEESELENSEKIIDYKFEPKPAEVLERLLPRLVEMQVYHAILESNASRESARMMAMKSASDAANDMMTQLEYSFNQIRQSAITQEISEITSGRAALE